MQCAYEMKKQQPKMEEAVVVAPNAAALAGDFQVPNSSSTMDGYLVRYKGTFYSIKPKPYEPERMTTDVAWIQLRESVDASTAYRRWFEKQRKLSRLLQQWTT